MQDGLPIRDASGTEVARLRWEHVNHSFYVRCTKHQRCTFSKTLKSSDSAKRRGQGRPLGTLLLWALSDCTDKAAHEAFKRHAGKPDNKPERSLVRARAKAETGSEFYFGLERLRHLGEDSEPEEVPHP
jgi:hypothetical protein